MKGLFAAPFVWMDVQGPFFKGQLDFIQCRMPVDLQQIIKGAHHGSPFRPSAQKTPRMSSRIQGTLVHYWCALPLKGDKVVTIADKDM